MLMDMYVRVSRVGDRRGEAYRSPKQQEQAMRAWAEREGVEVGKLMVEENVGGGRRAQDRGLEELIQRAERGVTDGVIVYRINRFGRRMRDTVAAVGRLQDAGKRLVSVDDGYDTDQPAGQILLGVFAGIAEQQLEERTANWAVSVEEAVEEGKHIACRAPIGYRRKDEVESRYDEKGKLIRDARLVLDPLKARIVREAFEMRRRGESQGQIVKMMEGELDRRVSKQTVTGILRNPAYLGQARGPGGVVKHDAHEAVVDPELFRGAQAVKGKYYPRNGSMAAQTVLAGIVHCAECGHRLQVTGRTLPDRSRTAMYVCRWPECERPANIDAARLDRYVMEIVQADVSGPMAGLTAEEEQKLEARATLKAAEEELQRFGDPALSTELGEDIWRRGLSLASRRVNEARQRVWDLGGFDDLQEDAPIIELDGRKVLYQPWGEDREADRRTLKRAIGTLTLAKADRRMGWQPLDERVTLKWADGSLPQVA
jgi:DNA invertase Pin-like site-specific DNA recombinase